MFINLYPTSHAEEIDESLSILDLAIRLQIGFREKFINNSCFTSNIGINLDTSSYLKEVSIDTNNLENRFRNHVLAVLGSAACAIDRALDNKFGDKDANDHSDIGSLRNIFYMIRCAFAHGPCTPKWHCRDQYCKSPYILIVSKDNSSRVVFTSDKSKKMKFEFDFSKLNNQHLNIAHFNGLDGFFLLAEYAKKQVE